jgi:hypothetical protein
VEEMASVDMKGVHETSAPGRQLDADVEGEPEIVNIDRIEKVYAYVHPINTPNKGKAMEN